MKKIRLSLPLAALVLALVASAFTARPETSPSTDPELYWFRASDLQYMNKDVKGDSNSGEIGRTGCDGSATPCEYGFLEEQLVNPANPGAGVQTGEQPQETIFVHQ